MATALLGTVWNVRMAVRPTGRKYEWAVFSLSLLVRCLSVLLCQTAFVPDEYWQSLEVAHKTAFGYGHMTWEWDKAIRSSIHPLLFAACYRVLSFLRLDSPEAVVLSPCLLQAVLAALCDLVVYRMAFQLWSSRSIATTALLIHLTSWFSLYCMTRTLSNSLETVLTTLGVYYWLKSRREKNGSATTAMKVGALSCLVRPTAIFMWLPLAIGHSVIDTYPVWTFVTIMLSVAFCVLPLSVVCDRLFYGKWVFVQYNFLHFNVFEGVANLYGTHPWYWYLTQGVVVVWLSWTPIVVVSFYGTILKTKERIAKQVAKRGGQWQSAFWKTMQLHHQFWLLVLITSEVLAHSLLPHKEFRFILPTLPLIACLIAPTVHHLWTCGKRWKMWLCVGLFASNLMTAGYFCLVHQRGTLDAVSLLRKELGRLKDPQRFSVLFLLPCHHAPLYSHIHYNASLRFLQCQPTSLSPSYVDEDTSFHTDPVLWLDREYPPSAIPPTYLVLYDVLEPRIQSFLRSYSKIADLFHTHLPDGPHVGLRVLVFVLKMD